MNEERVSKAKVELKLKVGSESKVVKFRKPPIGRRAPIMDMKSKIRRTGMSLDRLGKIFKIRKHKAS